MYPRLIWGPEVFNIFINELKDGTEHANSKLADDKCWGGVADTPDGYVALLPFQGTATVWRNKQTETSQSSGKSYLKPCIWKEITPCTSTGCEGQMEGKQLCREGLGDPGGQGIKIESPHP